MSQISLKSISGITSITTPAGVDNQLTLHNNNTSEAVKLDIAGNLHFNNHLNITGISTASNFKTGSSNLHSTGLTVGNALVHSTGINVGTGATVHSPATNVLTLGTNSNERLRLTSGGNVEIDSFGSPSTRTLSLRTGYLANANGGIGLAAKDHSGAAADGLGVYGTDGVSIYTANAGTVYERFRIDTSGHIHTGYTSDFGNDHLNILASDGGGIAIASNNVGNATAGDILGSLSFQGYLNTASYSSAEARISAIVPSNHTGSSAATDMVFYTKPASTGPGSSPSERLRIGSVGQIGIGGANYGTSGQVLTSQGSGSAVQWSSPAAPSVSQNTGTANNNIHQTIASGITWHTDKNNTEQTVGNISYCNTSNVYAIDIYVGMLFNASGGTYNYNSSHCYLTGYIFQSGKNYLNDGAWSQAQHFDMYFNTFGTVYTIPWDPSGTQTLKFYVTYSYNTNSNNSFRFDLISKHLK